MRARSTALVKIAMRRCMRAHLPAAREAEHVFNDQLARRGMGLAPRLSPALDTRPPKAPVHSRRPMAGDIAAIGPGAQGGRMHPQYRRGVAQAKPIVVVRRNHQKSPE